MSWRDFQRDLPSQRKSRSYGWVWATGLGFSAFVGLLYLLFGIQWSTPDSIEREVVAKSKAPEPQKSVSVKSDFSQRLKYRGVLQADDLSGVSQRIDRTLNQEKITVGLTIDRDLQRFISNRLERFRVDWSGVAVISPKTGAVLALASHSEKEPQIGNLAVRSTFPAASVFKVVTASAALEEGGYRRDTKVSYSGNMYGRGTRQILTDSGREGLTLNEAFAKSANIVFEKIAARNLDADTLRHYAIQYGFNEEIPFDFSPIMSLASIPVSNSVVDHAKTAAGFGEVTLSPLHGALIAGSVLNEGYMMAPYIISDVENANHEIEYAAKPLIWKQPVTPVTARELRRMMLTTITDGTARRSFRRVDRNPVLNKLVLGGKTGSLSGKNPPGRNEWFVGYARGGDKEIALGIVVVNDRIWRVKPSELMKEIAEYYFSARPVLEARAQSDSVRTP